MSIKHWVWLASASGVGPVTAAHLLRRFGTPEKVFFADKEELRNTEGVKSHDLSALDRKNIAAADKILASCDEIECSVITLQDAQYPERLRNIYDPPIVLYIRGKLPIIDEEAVIGVVGTRKCTPYGLTTAEDLGYNLARRGILVVSGLAKGVDAAAMRGALRGGGRVIGVIGSGLNVVYPPENKKLYEDVCVAGAIISEYPPGTPPLSQNFPARNRILSGVSIGVAVLESPKRSGALITAARALEQGRDVFAMPGNVGAKSCEGSNSLLREGAIPILSADDIASEYAELFPDRIIWEDSGNQSDQRNHLQKEIDKKPQVEYIDKGVILSNLTGDEKTVAEAIGSSTMHTDEIIISSNLNAQRVLAALTMLELKGYAKRNGGVWQLTIDNGQFTDGRHCFYV